jgi:hypothetical protein
MKLLFEEGGGAILWTPPIGSPGEFKQYVLFEPEVTIFPPAERTF